MFDLSNLIFDMQLIAIAVCNGNYNIIEVCYYVLLNILLLLLYLLFTINYKGIFYIVTNSYCYKYKYYLVTYQLTVQLQLTNSTGHFILFTT